MLSEVIFKSLEAVLQIDRRHKISYMLASLAEAVEVWVLEVVEDTELHLRREVEESEDFRGIGSGGAVSVCSTKLSARPQVSARVCSRLCGRIGVLRRDDIL